MTTFGEMEYDHCIRSLTFLAPVFMFRNVMRGAWCRVLGDQARGWGWQKLTMTPGPEPHDMISQSEARSVRCWPIRGWWSLCSSADHVRPRVMTRSDVVTPLSLTDTQREARVFRWECRTLGGLLIIMTPRPDYWCDTQMWLFFHHRHDISCGEIWLLRFVYCILVWLSCHGLMISVNSHYFYISHE